MSTTRVNVFNEQWKVNTENDSVIRQPSKEQQRLGKRDWEKYGLRRYSNASRAKLKRRRNTKTQVELLAATYKAHDVKIKEHQVYIEPDVLKNILLHLRDQTLNMDAVYIAEQYPTLFWNLCLHYKDAEHGLKELGLLNTTKRRCRRRQAPERFVDTEHHLESLRNCSDNSFSDLDDDEDDEDEDQLSSVEDGDYCE